MPETRSVVRKSRPWSALAGRQSHLYDVDDITVRNAAELRDTLRRAKPGTTIRLASGNYGNGIWIEKINGTKDLLILITGADERNPRRGSKSR